MRVPVMDIILSEPRRRWPEEEKKAAVALTFQPGMTVTGVAQSREITPSMLFSWRKRYRDELGFPKAPERTGVVPVTLQSPEEDAAARNITSTEVASEDGSILIVFDGAPRMKVKGRVDPALAATLARALAGR